jgi:hypothetical protein
MGKWIIKGSYLEEDGHDIFEGAIPTEKNYENLRIS